ncbi:gamma-glutamyl-gamma-aminobutyrate hydrolase family protein [Candidatus Woesearchaeota archaeon]|nr:gamma-glutamyl-gamma-aminobutyrate hydrolase family protein [Candidatus Woesearchaeota archaeon]
MLIAISQRSMKMDKGANRDALENDYIEYYEKFGITLVPVPNVSRNLDKYFKDMPINGIILSGGNSINPALYGAKGMDEDFSAERDNTEKKLVEIALKRKLPLLGTCRGGQFINVFFGGKLVQDIEQKTGTSHVRVGHGVEIVDKKAEKYLGRKKFVVNSYHKQGVDKSTLSRQLKPFAVSDDGIIEGFYYPKHMIAGILWHPEREGCDKEANKKLVKAFIEGKLFWRK